MGDWRNNKDEEVELDGIGGVNILVKADVHRSGQWFCYVCASARIILSFRSLRLTAPTRHQLPLLRIREPSRNRRLRQNGQTCRIPSRRPAQLRRLAYRHRGETRQSRQQARILSPHFPITPLQTLPQWKQIFLKNSLSVG